MARTGHVSEWDIFINKILSEEMHENLCRWDVCLIFYENFTHVQQGKFNVFQRFSVIENLLEKAHVDRERFETKTLFSNVSGLM